MKIVIYVIDPERYANGDYAYSMSATTRDQWDFWKEQRLNEDRLYLAEMDVDMDSISRDLAASAATEALNKRMEDIRAKTEAELTVLEKRKSNLLSLPGVVS